MRAIIFTALLSAAIAQLAGQTSDDDRPLTVGNGVTPPRVLSKVEPTYSPDARAEQVQGTVVLEVVVSRRGLAENIRVLSPLGFGLDEAAQGAVQRWRFAPGMKDGKPVPVIATIEVNFRFQGVSFDQKFERRRTRFNEALAGLKSPNPKLIDHAVKEIEALAKEKFPPAMTRFGSFEIAGEHVARNPEDGWALMEKAAAKNYGPAIYRIAARQAAGDGVAKNVEAGLDKMRHAAALGSLEADVDLGVRYEKAMDVAADPGRSRHYFRLCASRGLKVCQYRLASSLLNAPNRSDRDYVEALAWLQLAADNGSEEAKAAYASESAKLSDGQMNAVSGLMKRLAPR